MNRNRKAFGILLVIAAPVIVVIGYANKPSAQVCQTINQINANLGNPGSCSSSPSTGWWVFAAVVFALGLLMLAPWILRWLTGKQDVKGGLS
jgi:H+/Cl- antiporter ClcA